MLRSMPAPAIYMGHNWATPETFRKYMAARKAKATVVLLKRMLLVIERIPLSERSEPSASGGKCDF
jgi:hypothetical protein